MTDEVWKSIAQVCALLTPLFVFIGRLISHLEHKKTEKSVKKTDADIMEIKLYMNGELAKKLEQARQEGRDEETNKKK